MSKRLSTERWSTVRDALAAQIESGALRPGERLEPEPALATKLGVSRATLREALRSLAESGSITRTRGAGTYVTRRPRVRNNLDSNFGVTDLIRSMGMRPGTEALSIFEAEATAAEADDLGVELGSKVVIIERVRLADGRPVVFSRDILPARLVGDRIRALGVLREASIYSILGRDLGLVIAQGVARIEPMAAPRWLADALRVPIKTILLYLHQVDLDEAGKPVLLSHEYHVADAFEITVMRRGPGRQSPT